MHRRLLAALLSGALSVLSGCGRPAGTDASSTAPQPPRDRGMRLAAGMSRPMAETARMHAVAGRWRSKSGVVAGGPLQWVQLEVANDRSFSLQIREPAPGGRGEAVDVNATGHFEWTPGGVIVAKAEGARPPLQAFSSWRGSFPDDRTMHVTAGGRTYSLSYQGL